MSCITELFFTRTVTTEVRVGISMSCAKNIDLVQCDTAPRLEFVIKDCENGTISTGVSGVNLYLARVSCGEDCSVSNEGHTGLSAVDYLNGRWAYQLFPGDTSAAGTYFGDLEVVYDDGSRQTSPSPIRINVRERSCRVCF